MGVQVIVGTTLAIAGSTGTTVTVADSSCYQLAAAIKALNSAYQVLACSSDPVIVGTQVLYSISSTTPASVLVSTVTYTYYPPVSPSYADSSLPVFQGASRQYVKAAVSTAQPASSVITVKDAFGTATPDQYTAIAAVFGLILCSAVVVWGVKQVYKLLVTRPES